MEKSVLDYWFPMKNEYQKFWFSNSNDSEIKHLFLSRLLESRRGLPIPCSAPCSAPLEMMMEKVILHDQMSRNIFRGSPEGRAGDDEIALPYAEWLIELFMSGSPFRQDYLMFSCLPLRHTGKYELCKRVIDVINYAERRDDVVENPSLWMKFKIASYNSLYEHEFLICREQPPPRHPSIFIRDMSEYKCVFNETVRLDRWREEGNIHDEVTQTVWNSICKYDLGGVAFIVSLSGGVDSMVILHSLKTLSRLHKFDVVALHIEYINRPEAEMESRAVELYCSQLCVKYHAIKVDYMVRQHGGDKYKIVPREVFEETAKGIRFRFYNTAREKYGAKLVALGHHKDDLIENVVANMMSGRDIGDLPVIDEYEVQNGAPLWRPLLPHLKRDILDYAERYGIPYMYNSTPPMCMRGRLRLEVAPLLESVFPSYKEGIFSISEQSRDLKRYFSRRVVEPVVASIFSGPLGFSFDVDLLADAPLNVWTTTFSEVVHSMGLSMLKRGVMETIIRNVENNIDFSIYVGNNYYVSRCGAGKIIFRDRSYFSGEVSSKELLITDLELLSTDLELLSTVVGGTTVRLSENISGERVVPSLRELLEGKIRYTVDRGSSLHIGNTIPKRMKKYFREFFGCQMEVLSSYVWVMSSHIESHNTLVTVDIGRNPAFSPE
jgi:tRNA(Ile)-lysidine synthetase-like protein